MFIQFLVLGLGSGAVYALLGDGIVLIFRSSGILNLAHGAMAMVAGYLTTVLVTEHKWPVGLAIVVVILVTAMVGLVMDLAVMRRLRSVSPLTRLIATLGLFLTLYSAASVLWPNPPGLAVAVFHPQPVDVLGTTVPSDRLWTLGTAIVLTAVLWAVWRFSRLGWLAEAVAENEQAAEALGWSPQLVSTCTWGIGGALAGVAGVLIAPLTQLDVSNLSLLIIPGLAAALIGGFRSFPGTLIGGLVIGSAQSEASTYVHVTGAAAIVPFVVIVLVLGVTGSPLPLRGHIFDRLPDVGGGRIRPKVLAGAVVVAVVASSIITSTNWLAAVGATFAAGIVLLSLVVLIGYAGQLSLAQYALAGLGALYTAQLVANSHWPFVPAAIVGIAGTALTGIIFALPALRTRGVNLAVVTLALGLALQAAVFDNPRFAGGIDGLNIEGAQKLFGWSIDPLTHPGRYTTVSIIAFIVAAVAVANLRRGSTGRRLLAIRGNERAAAAAGINVYAAKVQAFALSGALAALGGIILVFQLPVATFSTFTPLNSIFTVAVAVIGGIGYVMGALLGATFTPASVGSIIALHWQQIDIYLPMIGGVLVVVNLVIAKQGLAEDMMQKFARWRKQSALVPAAASEAAMRPPEITPKTLAVGAVTVRYGAVTAVKEVSLTVAPGTVVGLIGPNGAGKTSLMDAITGFTAAHGSVTIDGQPVDKWPPYRRARAGLVRSFQGLELFEELTVRDNLIAAGEPRARFTVLTDLVRPRGRVLPPAAAAAIHQFKLGDCLDRRPADLPFGQQRLVAVARAVASAPGILLLDEPVSGLDTNESAEIGALVRQLADHWGMAILVIEHDMGFVMNVCDHIVVLDFGHEIAAGPPSAIKKNSATLAAYLGKQTSSAENAEDQARKVSL